MLIDSLVRGNDDLIDTTTQKGENLLVIKRRSKEVDILTKEVEKLQKEAEDVVFLRQSLVVPLKKELSKQVSDLEIYTESVRLKEIDIQINIAQNLISFSIAILVAFVSIPEIEGNNYIPLAAVIGCSFYLIYLIHRRKDVLRKENYTYLNNGVRSAKSLARELDTVLSFLEEKNSIIKEKVNKIKEKLHVDLS